MTTPVVLLHPLGVDHRFWARLRAVLPARLGTQHAPDLLGHGRAPLPDPGAGIDAFADAVEREVLACGGRAHLVGVSLGALVAQVVAARSPELVDRLVLADGVAVYPDAMRTMWRERAATVRAQGVGVVAESMEALWFTAGFRHEEAAEVARVRDLLQQTDPEGYARTCEALAVVDARGLAPAITAPTLVACGVEDAPPFRAGAAWLAEHLPDARSVWLGGGHATAYERPAEFADALLGFLG